MRCARCGCGLKGLVCNECGFDHEETQILFLGQVEETEISAAGKRAPVTVGDFQISGGTLVRYQGSDPEPQIPDGIRVIGARAFDYNQHIRRIRIPESVTTIGKYAFQTCKNLEQLELPDTLTTIEAGAFWGCEAIGTLRIPAGIRRISENAFGGCKGLKELTVPGNVETVEAGAFRLCHGLRNLVLEEGVRRLADHAFGNCTSLQTVTVPSTLCQVGESPYISAFEVCFRIKVVHASARWKEAHRDLLQKILPFDDDRLNFMMEGTKLMRYWGRAAAPQIPASTTRIGAGAFMNNIAVKEITVPESVREIEQNAFWGCTAQVIRLPEHLQTLGSRAFYRCLRLEMIRLPGELREIPLGAFENCVSLREVEIPGNVQKVADNAFTSCTSLKKLVIRPGVRYIEEAFRYCTDLEEVEIPDSVEKIASRAFEKDDAIRVFRASPQWKAAHKDMIEKLPKAAQ